MAKFSLFAALLMLAPATALTRFGMTMRKRPVSLMKGKTSVLLTKDIPSVGRANEVVTVRDGYLMNFLIPRSMAVPATDDALEKVKEIRAAMAAEDAANLAAAEGMKATLDELAGVVITKKVGDKGIIFGSVTAAEVVAAIETASGLELGSPKVSYPEISAVGSYDVKVTVHPQVIAVVSVKVEAEA